MPGTDPFEPNDPLQRMLRDVERHRARTREIEMRTPPHHARARFQHSCRIV